MGQVSALNVSCFQQSRQALPANFHINSHIRNPQTSTMRPSQHTSGGGRAMACRVPCAATAARHTVAAALSAACSAAGSSRTAGMWMDTLCASTWTQMQKGGKERQKGDSNKDGEHAHTTWG